MKTFFIFLASILMLSIKANQQALEIQCKTSKPEYDFVLKRSPDTGITYALLFTQVDLEVYLALSAEDIQQEDTLGFNFNNEESQRAIHVDLRTGNGYFHLAWLQFDESQVSLYNCHSTL